MAARNSESILKDLDKILEGSPWKGPPSDLSHLSDPDHLESLKKLGNYEEVVSKWIAEKASKLINSTEFHICSIGCADGALDSLILSQLATGSPRVAFQYVGIDIDEQVCEVAEDRLSALAPNVKAKAVSRDYDDLEEEDLASFDLIMMINSAAFAHDAASLERMLRGASQLLKPKGELIIISSSRQSFGALITRFWLHQYKHVMYTTELITEELKKIGSTSKVLKKAINFDLTECFTDKFESVHSKQILDHFTLVRLEEYAPTVSELCIKYLESIAQEKPNKYIVVSICDMIVVSRHN